MQIPDEAVEAAAKVLSADKISNHAGDNAPQIIDACEKVARKVLEAAAPILLSHERQQTADAHRDAIVNRDTADRLERELENAKAEAWDRCAASIVDERGNPIIPDSNTNPYRRQA
jgi:dihydropteroate synthase